MAEIKIDSRQEMQRLGACLAKTAQAGDLLLLNGDLGAGKTTLTQGLGRALGIKRPVKSPTFTIVREYREGRLPLFHMDFYRLENDDLSSIDLPAYLSSGGIVVIEWPQVIKTDLPREFLQLTLKGVDNTLDSTQRVVSTQVQGSKAQVWLAAALTAFKKEV